MHAESAGVFGYRFPALDMDMKEKTTPHDTDEIVKLSNREADHLLAQAARARLAEINGYWALCQSNPDQAAQLAAAAPPIISDIFYLSSFTHSPPLPSTVAGLSKATTRLLEVHAIRDSFVPSSSALTDPVDAFWENRQVVGLKVVNGEALVVLRYEGPLFNPGTVPAREMIGEEYGFMVCQRESIGDGGEFEYLIAYVLGGMDNNGNWESIRIDLKSRNDLMRDLQAMEALVVRGRLGEEFLALHPLPAFPTSCDALIAQLQEHKARLRRAGAITVEQQAIVDSRTLPLRDRMAQLRQNMGQAEDEIELIRQEIAEAEARAVEEETGFARGDKVRHRFTDHEGTLEIVNFGGAAQFRLYATTMYLTEDIRRGEWVKVVTP